MAEEFDPQATAEWSIKPFVEAFWKKLEATSQNILSTFVAAPHVHSETGQKARVLMADGMVILALTLPPGLIFAAFAAGGLIAMGFASFLLLFAWVLGCLFVSWFPVSWRHRGSIAFVYSMILVGTWFYIRSNFVPPLSPDELAKKIASELSESTPDGKPKSVSDEQIGKLKEIEAIVGKEENELRQDVDLEGLLATNIAIQQIRIGLRNAGNKGFPYDRYTQGDGTFMMVLTGGDYHMTPSGPFIDEGPHDIKFLITTKKYQDSYRQIIQLTDSSLVPEKVKTSLLAYKKLIDENVETLGHVLNEAIHESDDYFLKNSVAGTPYSGALHQRYIHRLKPLKPAADNVLSSISKYWHTN